MQAWAGTEELDDAFLFIMRVSGSMLDNNTHRRGCVRVASEEFNEMVSLLRVLKLVYVAVVKNTYQRSLVPRDCKCWRH